MVLNITKYQITNKRMLTLAEEIFARGNSYMLFGFEEKFGGHFRPVVQIPDILTRSWQRAGMADFRIDQP